MMCRHVAQWIVALTCGLICGCQRLSSEERVIAAGRGAEAVLFKAHSSLSRASAVSLDRHGKSEEAWAFSILVKYGKPETAQNDLDDVSSATRPNPASAIYAYARLRLVSSAGIREMQFILDPEFRERNVALREPGQAERVVSVREALSRLEAVGFEALLLKEIPDLYRTQ